MSSTPHSPPETPLKLQSQMAVDGVTPARKRGPDGPVKAHGEGEISPAQSPGLNSLIKVEKPTQSQVQIPPSAQPPRSDQAGKPQETRPREEVEAGADENETQAENNTQDPNAELPEFDYDQLNAECTAAIKTASEEEDKLLDEFHAYAELFSTWSQAASGRDNTRASKRLKTRETYVELAEERLEAKKKHYASVVDAFQKALNLLGQ